MTRENLKEIIYNAKSKIKCANITYHESLLNPSKNITKVLKINYTDEEYNNFMNFILLYDITIHSSYGKLTRFSGNIFFEDGTYIYKDIDTNKDEWYVKNVEIDI